MTWEERLLELPGGRVAMMASLAFLEPFEPDAPEGSDFANDCSRAYALQRLDTIIGNYLGGLRDADEAPTIAQARAYLCKIEKQSRELEIILGKMTEWTLKPLYDVLDYPYYESSLFISASGEDIPVPWEFDTPGCPGWQSKLDGLSCWAGKAAENLDGISKGGPLTLATIEGGNPKTQLVLDCEKTALEFRKDYGLSKDGPLARFVREVHRLAVGNEGGGWEDAIKDVADWRNNFSHPFWDEWAQITEERFRLGAEFGFLPLGALPMGIPEVDALKERIDALFNIGKGMTKGPHKLREYRKNHGGENPPMPKGVPPVEPTP